MHIAGRPHENDYFGILRHLFDGELGVDFGLLDRIGIDSGNGRVVDAVVDGHYLDAGLHRILDRGDLRFGVKRLQQDEIVLIGDSIFDVRGDQFVLALAVKDCHLRIRELLAFLDHGVGQPGGEGVALGTCDIGNTVIFPVLRRWHLAPGRGGGQHQSAGKAKRELSGQFHVDSPLVG